MSDGNNATYSEGVVVSFDPKIIDLSNLIRIHLHTHSATSNHSMRVKYRSAVYTVDHNQQQIVNDILSNLQVDFDLPLITKAMPLVNFKQNQEKYLNYYYSNPEKSFCQTQIQPKLSLLMTKFSNHINDNRDTIPIKK